MIPAPGRPVDAGIPVAAVVARVAATRPARVAAEFGDEFVTYGRLNTTIAAYRAVMDEQGVDENAAIFAAILNTLPGLADETPGRVTDRITSILRGITGDTAAWTDGDQTRQVG
ncbi:hypothetical protein BFL43_24925 [Williamsia sp. 1135]|nr:hypothetical protein BFL43_24925 [Williamsia sp. 1135]